MLLSEEENAYGLQVTGLFGWMGSAVFVAHSP